jgi:hypothetical protein
MERVDDKPPVTTYEALGLPEPVIKVGPLSDLGPLIRGYSKHYRGNHRSSNKGVGFKALLRNNWMKSIR